jgi:hypothetical protein
VWFLFHTLAEKIKDEHASTELAVIVTHVISICNNLPCPDCQQHATQKMNMTNKAAIITSKDTFIHFLWQFHNEVNKRTKAPFYPKESLELYKRAKTGEVIRSFISIMGGTSNNSKTMLNGFHRQLYLKKFVDYIKANLHKYNP